MAYYNPYITGSYNPLYDLTNQGFLDCSVVFSKRESGVPWFCVVPIDIQPSSHTETKKRYDEVFRAPQNILNIYTYTLGVQRPLKEWLSTKDHYFSRDLQSTIPGDYYFNGLWLPGYIPEGRIWMSRVVFVLFFCFCHFCLYKSWQIWRKTTETKETNTWKVTIRKSTLR